MAIRHTRQWERAVAEFLASPVDDVARKHGRAVVADVLAAAVAGSAAPGSPASRDGAFVDGKASILGTDRRVAPPQAAMTNAAAAIAQEIEGGTTRGPRRCRDRRRRARRRGGEQRRRRGVRRRVYSGLRYLCPAGTGDLRDERPDERRDPVARSEPALDVDDRGAGRDERPLSGRDPEELTETFRIAANLAVVSMHDPYAEGAPARNFTAGFSAQAGVTAALTALAGLEGSRAAIEEVYDPFEELLPDGFASQFETLGEEWAIAEHYFKPYPSCRYTHPPLDALREGDRRAGGRRQRAIGRQAGDRPGRRGGDHGQDVRQRDRHVSRRARDDDRREVLRTVRAGDVPLSGSVDLDHFTAEALADETVQSVAARVELREDDGYEAAFPESWGASVVVELRDGTTLTGARDYPRGDYRDPIPDAEYRARNRALLAHGLGGGGNITPESTRRSTPSTRSRSARSGRRSTRSDRNTEQTFCWTERTRQILHPAMRSVEYGTRRHTEHGIGRSDRTIVPYHRTAR